VCRDVTADVPPDTSAYSINTGSIPQRTLAPVSCHASTRLLNPLKSEAHKYRLLLLFNRRGNWFFNGANFSCVYLCLRLSAVSYLTLLLVSFRLSRNGAVSTKHWGKRLSLFTVSDKRVSGQNLRLSINFYCKVPSIHHNWISVVVLQLVNQATCFGRFIRPSSGLKNNTVN